MQINKPSIPQGTRDFGAAVIYKRNYIINTIKMVFENYGFEPLETPAFENLTTLMGKYGDEGDKLIFKILNNGLAEKAEKTTAGFEEILQGKNAVAITERALKYDLTIPFARYVAMNFGQLNMPFKRYQIQPVWRADKPQKGRYREFMQCDADIVGSQSIWNEIDLLNIYADVFAALKLEVNIKLNSRKILVALAEIAGGENNMQAITVAIDKLDKIGLEKVLVELEMKGLTQQQQETITKYLLIKGSNSEKLNSLKQLLGNSELGNEGIAELEQILHLATLNNETATLIIDPTLARGLNYYTGAIIEVAAKNFEMGSIGGGGRYNNLTDLFGVKNVPGVGISFGLDRIYDVLEGMHLFPENEIGKAPKVLFLNHGMEHAKECYILLQQLRKNGVSAELYYDAAKVDKQYKYAERKGVKYVINIQKNDENENIWLLKNILTGIQQKMNLDSIFSFNFI